MKLLIIGGGIGGLTTGLACQHFNIDFELFEAAPAIREVGAGIWVPPNAMQVMHRLGLAGKIREAGKELETISVGGPSGDIWYSLRTSDVVRKYQFGTIAIHRGRLQSILYQALPQSSIHTGKRLTSVSEENGTVTAVFHDGSRATGDCLIGADGLRSATRQQLFGNLPLRYSGQTCWRGVVNHKLPEDISGAMRELWGKHPGQRFAYSQITPGEVYYYGTLATSAGQQHEPETVKALLTKNFNSFGHIVQSIIRDIDPATVIRTDLFDLKPISTWTKGNIALLGDAAHATTPNLGQGAAQAIEDAFVLASSMNETKNVPEALLRYQRKRLSRAHHIVNTSWKFGQMTNMRNPVGIKVRNWVIKSTPSFITNKQIDKIYRVDF